MEPRKQEINFSDYCTSVQVTNKLYEMGKYFVEQTLQKCPQGFNPFDVHRTRVSVYDVQCESVAEVLIWYNDLYDSSDNYCITLDAQEFCENIDKCVDKFVKNFIDYEERRRARALEEKKAREKERDLEEYERIKQKYNL
jgi:hypothetical protein